MAHWLFQYQVKAEPVLVPAAAEDVTLDKWFRAWTEPIRVADRTAAAASGAVYQGEPIAPPAPAPELAWFAPLAEPVRPKDRRAALDARERYQGEPIAPVVEPELGWLRPFSEPARATLRGPEGGAAAPILVPLAAFGWWAGLAEPMRLPRRVREGRMARSLAPIAAPVGPVPATATLSDAGVVTVTLSDAAVVTVTLSDAAA